MSEKQRLQLENELLMTCSKAQAINKYIDELEESSKLSELWCKSQQENQELKNQIEELKLQNFNLREDIMIKKISFPSKEIKDKTFFDLYDMPTYEELKNKVEKLTGENNDIEEKYIRERDKAIKWRLKLSDLEEENEYLNISLMQKVKIINELEKWLKKQIEECNNYSKYIEKKVSELKARSSGKTYIANEIMKNEVAKKVIQEFLDKLNELRGKNE